MKNIMLSIRKQYIPPRIVSQMAIIPEDSVLVGSIVDDIEYIESTGQDVETCDFNDVVFNFDWED